MFKPLAVLCVLAVVIEARPKWDYLPHSGGYVPVYIRVGDTPLEEISPELAEAFHEIPAGRNAHKNIEASPESPELSDQPQDFPDETVDHRPYEKQVLEKKATEVDAPAERR